MSAESVSEMRSEAAIAPEVAIAAAWWTQELEQGDTEVKEKFRRALEDLAQREFVAHGEVMLRVDYDPDEILLQALGAAGIECRGFMFSARELFPFKTTMWVKPNDVRVRVGRGACWEWLIGAAPPPESEDE